VLSERSPYSSAQRVPISLVAREPDGWYCGPPPEEFRFFANSPAFIDTIAIAQRPGATFRFDYSGTDVIVWACTTGARLRITINGAEIEIDVPADPAPRFRDYRIGPLAHSGNTLIVEALTAPVLLGDLMYFGNPR
jgi:hypothetical protein